MLEEKIKSSISFYSRVSNNYIIYDNIKLFRSNTRPLTVIDYMILQKESIILIKRYYGAGNKESIKRQRDKKTDSLKKARNNLIKNLKSELNGRKIYGFLYNVSREEGEIVYF